MVDELLFRHVAGTRLGERIFSRPRAIVFILEVAKLGGDRRGELGRSRRAWCGSSTGWIGLTPQERDALEVASVEGRVLIAGRSPRVLERDAHPHAQAAAGASNAGTIVAPGEHAFRFDHGKIREVILNRLAEPLRREYHGAVAASLLAERNGRLRDAVLAHPSRRGGRRCGGPALPAARGSRAASGVRQRRRLHHLGLALATLDAHPRSDAARRRRRCGSETAEIHGS